MNTKKLPSFYFKLYGFVLMSFTSMTLAQEWTQVPEMDSTEVLAVVERANMLYALTPVQMFRSLNEGTSWSTAPAVPNAASGFYKLFAYRNQLYIGTFNDGIFRSPDSGQSWQDGSAGLSGLAKNITGFTGLGDSLYAGTENGVYVQNIVTGSPWSAFNVGLFRLGVTAIGTHGNAVIVGSGLHLFRRSQRDSQWKEAYFDSAGVQRQVYDIFSYGEYVYAGTDRGVYRADSDLQIWSKTDIAAFPNQSIVTFALNGQELMAGLSNGNEHWIFATKDAGLTWEIRDHQFAFLNELLVSGERLWAARDDGLWHYELGDPTGIKEPSASMPDNFSLQQNFPNPFNPATRISFQLQKSAFVTLTVYDTLGRMARILVHEVREPGSHVVDFEAAGLASGVYLYRLQAGEFSVVKRMLLVK